MMVTAGQLVVNDGECRLMNVKDAVWLVADG